MKTRGRKPKPVVAVNPDGSMNGWFDGIMDAMRLYHLDRTCILQSIRTGRLYKGLRWVYKEDYDLAATVMDTKRFAYERRPAAGRNLSGKFCKGCKVPQPPKPAYYTKQQRFIRCNAKRKYGYKVGNVEDQATRYHIYYDSDTRRSPRFEKHCIDNKIAVLPVMARTVEAWGQETTTTTND